MNQILEMGKTKIEFGKDCILTALPLYHIFAFTLNLMTFYNCGGTSLLIPNPRPLNNLKKPFEKYPPTWISGVNTLFNGLLGEEWFVKNIPKTLKASVAGGTALHSAVAERWKDATNTFVVEGYGLTETSPVVTFNPLDGLIKADTVGIPVPSTIVTFMDENGNEVPQGSPGEIAIKGPQVMGGYWKRPDETAKVIRDGWLLTGDIGVMDPEGYIKIVDRKKDMILVSGFNVYPNEVEDIIAKLEGVQEVAVIGVPNEQTGEAVKAFVVKKLPGLSEEDVIEHCKHYLTHYKLPKHVEFRPDLPKTPIGKILRKNLR
jgi:long-chain acyl-CoA synthetase